MTDRPERYDMFPIGTTITLETVMELESFEDAVMPLVEPKMLISEYADSHERWIVMWQSRQPLQELIRPRGFNGTIRNIDLTVMDDAYQQLQTARDRGWRLLGGPTPTRLDPEEQAQHLGFSLEAEARSSGRGALTGIRAELWYAPASSERRNTFGDLIRRIVTQPKLTEVGALESSREDSRTMAHQTIVYNLQHPLHGGLPDTSR